MVVDVVFAIVAAIQVKTAPLIFSRASLALPWVLWSSSVPIRPGQRLCPLSVFRLPLEEKSRSFPPPGFAETSQMSGYWA